MKAFLENDGSFFRLTSFHFVMLLFQIQLFCGCDGGCWKQVGVPGKEPTSLWGFSTEDIFITEHTSYVYHFDGEGLSRVDVGTPATLNDVWGTSKNNIFIAHTEGVFNYDGSSFLEMIDGQASFSSVWGTSGEDVFATTNHDSRIFHYDGLTWEEMNTPHSTARYNYLKSIWGSSATDVYAVGYEEDLDTVGRILHYDGSIWEEVLLTEEFAMFNDVWGSSPDDVYVTGSTSGIYHFDGNEWTLIETSSDERAISGRSTNDVFVVGFQGLILHYDGYEWNDDSIGSENWMYDVWTVPGAQVFAVGCKLDEYCREGTFFKNVCN